MERNTSQKYIGKDLLQCILSRRSVRKYLPEPVSRDIIEEVLKAGMNAPSAGDEQPWHFVILDSRDLLDKLSEMHPYAKMLKDVPAAILVCGDESTKRFKDFWVQDCSAASENILLAAHALGLGAVWIGIYSAENKDSDLYVVKVPDGDFILGIYPTESMAREVKNLLKIPENVSPFSIIALGYPAEEKPGRLRYDISKVHDNAW